MTLLKAVALRVLVAAGPVVYPMIETAGTRHP